VEIMDGLVRPMGVARPIRNMPRNLRRMMISAGIIPQKMVNHGIPEVESLEIQPGNPWQNRFGKCVVVGARKQRKTWLSNNRI
jgi:hypothetical protein